ncbi:MAG: tetratricopeptide repeat protein, partial [Kofleriaceae bacterium]
SGGTPTPVQPIDRPTGGADSYDRLLAKANDAAETNCTKAMDLYDKALEQKPNGVEALTGMGYCHIDAKQFATAFSKFRAALAVSPRFEPALWGVAETYLQQGRKEQAIEAFKAYLEAYPDSAKAKKQLDRLEASLQAPGSPPPAPAPGGSGEPTE